MNDRLSDGLLPGTDTKELDSCPLAPSLEPLTERVAALEKCTGQLKVDIAGVKLQVENVATQASQVVTDTAAIRAAIIGATRIGTFVKRHGRTFAGGVMGVAIGSGFFSEATLHKFRIMIAILLGA